MCVAGARQGASEQRGHQHHWHLQLWERSGRQERTARQKNCRPNSRTENRASNNSKPGAGLFSATGACDVFNSLVPIGPEDRRRPVPMLLSIP